MIIEKEMTKTQPLVSIVVITYNSSKYVLETLESAKEQTYRNIELIISDDCSTDSTVEICRQWLEHNKERFVNTELITTLKNTGIAPNCNRGLNLARGEWLKLIAGDDVLYEDAINKLIKFILLNLECSLVFGRSHFLKEGILTPDHIPHVFSLDQNHQKIQIIKGSGVAAAGAFIKRKLLLDFGGFNEHYPMIEDAPLWIKLSCAGVYFYFLDTFVAKYRIHENNSSRGSGDEYIRLKFFLEKEKIIKEIMIPLLKKEKLWMKVFELINHVAVMRLIILFGNKNNIFSKILNFFVINQSIRRISVFIKTL